MADKIKDAQDRMLDSMFASDPIADNGFSNRVVRRIQRRLWLRRLSMPIAIVLGLALAFQPAMDLLQALAGLLDTIPTHIISVPVGWIPKLQNVVLAGMLVVTGIFGLRMLED